MMKRSISRLLVRLLCVGLSAAAYPVRGQPEVPPIPVADAQPLAANVSRLGQALEFLGAPLETQISRDLQTAASARDAVRLQTLLDAQVLFVVTINPESRVKVQRGAA